MRRKRAVAKTPKHQQLIIFFLPIILTTIGLVFIFEASSVTAFRTLNDSFYYLKLQALWFFIGVVIMVLFASFDYRRLYYVAFPALLVSMVLLIGVLIPGIGHKVSGARRWIDLGILKIQPSEIVKFSIILYLSSWFTNREKNRFLSYFGLLAFILGLIMLQPDMGTAIIVFNIFIVLYFLSGYKLHYLLFLIPAAGAGFIMLVKTSPYRMRRLLAFLNPDLDPLGITYHVKQILISLSSGGILGRGFSGSRQKYQFLPEAHTDSIFAIIGEEFGFVGAFILISLYIYLIYKAYSIAKNAKDNYGRLLAGAIFSLLSFQVIVNLGSMVNLIPLTGVPLPFISYGGSSLLVFFALMGILINIGKHTNP